jgi:protein involved in sex pheromone biosynthesis
MIKLKILAALTLTLFVSGCLETKEEAEARQAQFNGKTVAQVVAVIGKPIAQDKSRAIWQFQSSYTRSVPIQQYINGKWVTRGYRTEQVNVDCTYTASLNSGRVTNSKYEGNSCGRYAPKLKKKK